MLIGWRWAPLRPRKILLCLKIISHLKAKNICREVSLKCLSAYLKASAWRSFWKHPLLQFHHKSRQHVSTPPTLHTWSWLGSIAVLSVPRVLFVISSRVREEISQILWLLNDNSRFLSVSIIPRAQKQHDLYLTAILSVLRADKMPKIGFKDKH